MSETNGLLSRHFRPLLSTTPTFDHGGERAERRETESSGAGKATSASVLLCWELQHARGTHPHDGESSLLGSLARGGTTATVAMRSEVHGVAGVLDHAPVALCGGRRRGAVMGSAAE